VYYEKFSRIDDAFYREKQVQNWSQAKKRALIAGASEKLPELAKKDFSKISTDAHLDTICLR
jgi:putative endonuclease